MQKRILKQLERRVIAIELPLRQRAANLVGIVNRNEQLAAHKASMFRHEQNRINQMLMAHTSHPSSVLKAVEEVRRDLQCLATPSRR